MLRFHLDELLDLALDLVDCHWIVTLHEPWLLLMLFPEGAGVLVLVSVHVVLVLLLDAVEVTLASLQARELLEGLEGLAHGRVEEAIALEFSAFTLASTPSVG